VELDDVRTILTSSTPDDWHQPGGWPTYHDWLAPLVDGQPIGVHEQYAVYRHDVRLTAAWGMETPGDNNPHDPDAAPWATFADRTVYSVLVDVFYCGALVERLDAAVVDGGRALLPYPRTHALAEVSDYLSRDKPSPPFGWSVTSYQRDALRLFHGLQHGPTSYADYVARSGFVVDDSAES
jgi:hypothetical protein